jgi:hypothetical protein
MLQPKIFKFKKLGVLTIDSSSCYLHRKLGISVFFDVGLS